MRNKQHVHNIAKSILWKNRLSNVSIDNLFFLIEDAGYEIIEYEENEIDTLPYFKQLNIRDYARINTAFSYASGGVQAVFMRGELSTEDKLYVLAHEYGHIILGHLRNKTSIIESVGYEREANEFAHFLLNDSHIHKAVIKLSTNYHKSVAVLFASIILILALGIIVQHENKKRYYDFYFVSSGGEKYHTQNCSYIKDKKNTHRMTIEEFETGHYTPCSACVTELKNGE